jgi:hypothetical protein
MIQAPGENLKKLFCGNIFSLFCKLHRFTALGKLFAIAKWSSFRQSLIKFTPKKFFEIISCGLYYNTFYGRNFVLHYARLFFTVRQ